MPKTRITLPDGIDHISVLDDTGRLDASLEPKIDPEVLLRLYHGCCSRGASMSACSRSSGRAASAPLGRSRVRRRAP